MTTKQLITGLGILLLTACGGGARPSAPAPAALPTPRTDEERLAYALAGQTWSDAQTQAIARLDSLRGREWVSERMVRLVADEATPREVRINALLQLGDRRDPTTFRAFREGIRSSDVTTRSAAMVGLGDLILLREDEAVELLRRGLHDPDPLVQAKALQSLTDVDVFALREFVGRRQSAELRKVATDLIRVAEARGAPLDSVPVSAGGELVRTLESGHRLRFRATQAWPLWDAAAGELWVTTPQGQEVRVADSVEVVARVVPAFFSADGQYLVYESNRTIRVRDLTSGTDRVVGPGIAPRGMPFGTGFVYGVRAEQAEGQTPEQARITYTMWSAGFAPGSRPEQFGRLNARVRPDTHGAASPLRWMRVRERDGVFTLEGQGIDGTVLPDPFQEAARQ